MSKKQPEIVVKFWNGPMIKAASVIVPNGGRKPIMIEARCSVDNNEHIIPEVTIKATFFDTRSMISGSICSVDVLPEKYKYLVKSVTDAARMTIEEVDTAIACRQTFIKLFTEQMGFSPDGTRKQYYSVCNDDNINDMILS